MRGSKRIVLSKNKILIDLNGNKVILAHFFTIKDRRGC